MTNHKNLYIMKAILINLIGVLFLILIQHVVPQIYFITPLYLPILFLSVGLSLLKNSNLYLYMGFCFLLLSLTDLLIRLLGKGVSDDVGRGLVEGIFYITLVTTTLSLLFTKLKLRNNKKKLENSSVRLKFILLDILFVLICSLLTLLLYRA